MIFVDSQTRQVELDESVHVVDEIDRYLPYILLNRLEKPIKRRITEVIFILWGCFL